jgi:GNAT superfamily N-acetyltransferase
VFEDRITLVGGDSGTGKTVLYEMLEDLRLTDEYQAIKLFNYKSDNLLETIKQCRDTAVDTVRKDTTSNWRNQEGEGFMSEFVYITLREKPQLKETAAEWFHQKWGVPTEAYLECMEAYLNRETEYGWYLCMDDDNIIGGMGVIENDFHDRKDLSPNVCAVYTEDAYRCKGIAGKLLDMVVKDMKSKGITPLYLVTDHTGFYERYGWEFLCMVQGDGEPDMTRMYIHR